MKLTQVTIATLMLPPGKTEAIFFDDEIGGFGLRLRASGGSRWVYQYKLGSQHRRMTLGSLGALSATQARKTAGELQAMVRLGRDPAGEKAESRARTAETMGATLRLYLPYQQSRLKPGSYDEVARHLQKHCRELHGLQLASVTRRAVAARMAAIAAASGDVAANRTRASLAAFFAWCIREGLAEQNPVVGTGRRPERSRDRVLSLDELKGIWNALDDDDDYGSIMRLLILTGQRANEIAALAWSEVVDGDIVLPASRTKNHRRHVIPLAPAARAIIDAQPRRGAFVFGRDIDRPFSGWSRCKERLDARIGTLAHWTVHDLRRSVATGMAELGVAPHVVEALLNHVSGTKAGVAGVYNRAAYHGDVKKALEAWAERLASALSPR